MSAYRVILLPGVVLPVSEAYGALLAALADHVDAVSKELEVYSAAEPPPDYTLDHEVAGILAAADAHAWNTFHLVGYSGGGAAALAFTARYPDRVQSLALLEPAWAGSWDWTPAEAAIWEAHSALEGLPQDQLMREFTHLALRDGVQPPPPPQGELPSWMALRPAGIKALLQTFKTYDLNRYELSQFDRPVYYALGGQSNPDQYAAIAMRLAEVFPDFQLEVFEERHHFDPPHRIEPERLAASLRSLWSRAESAPQASDPQATGPQA